MKPADVLDIIRDVVNKVGIEDFIKVGLDKNEEANFMWYSCKGKEDFFVADRLFVCPFSWIENITYEYKKSEDDELLGFESEDVVFILHFHLKLDREFMISCDEDCNYLERAFFDGHETKFKRIDLAISKYTLLI